MPAVELHRLGRPPVEPLGLRLQHREPEDLAVDQTGRPVERRGADKVIHGFRVEGPTCRVFSTAIDHQPAAADHDAGPDPDICEAVAGRDPVVSGSVLGEPDQVTWLQPLGGP